jgi:hypothetical protein
MIKIIVLKSNDPLLDEVYLTHGNIFNIGKSQSSHMIVDTDHFPSNAFCLTLLNNGLLVKPLFDEPYKINNKKIKGSKICTVGTTITTDELTIKVETFSFEETEEYNVYAKNKIEKFNKESPEVSKYLLSIQEGLVSIEKAINDTK